MGKPDIIALDGPVGSGKTTIGTMLSERLGYRFLDTGDLYRALTLLVIRKGLSSEEDIIKLARDFSPRIEGRRIFIGDEDVTERLRDREVEERIPFISRIKDVRSCLVKIQRREASGGRIIVAGRDIGTVVLPDADLKIYLDAPLEERARRRYEEVKHKGMSYEEVLKSLKERDEMDMKREVGPLKPADDAIIINTENKSPEEVLSEILSLMEV